MAVSRPASLAAAGHHVCVLIQRSRRVVDKVRNLLVSRVENAESVFDFVGDELMLLRFGRAGEEVFVVVQGEALGGMGGIGKRGWIPDIFGVGGVEFWLYRLVNDVLMKSVLGKLTASGG